MMRSFSLEKVTLYCFLTGEMYMRSSSLSLGLAAFKDEAWESWSSSASVQLSSFSLKTTGFIWAGSLTLISTSFCRIADGTGRKQIEMCWKYLDLHCCIFKDCQGTFSDDAKWDDEHNLSTIPIYHNHQCIHIRKNLLLCSIATQVPSHLEAWLQYNTSGTCSAALSSCHWVTCSTQLPLSLTVWSGLFVIVTIAHVCTLYLPESRYPILLSLQYNLTRPK